MKISKLLLSVMAIALIFNSLVLSVSAEENESLVDKQKELIRDKNVNIDVMTDKEVKDLYKMEEEIEEAKNLKNEIEKNNFEKVLIENENSKIKYSALTSEGKVYTYMSNDIYKNKETNELIVTQTIYDSYSNEIKQFVAEKRSMEDPDQKEILLNYKDENIDNQNIDKKDNDDGISLFKSFTWNGKSFACSMTGLFACGQYCAVWAMVNPIAGGTCSAVCGTVFAAACAVS